MAGDHPAGRGASITGAWLREALAAHKRGDYATALRACGAAPGDANSQLSAHTVRASALAKLDRVGEALREIEAAVALGAQSAELCRLAAELSAKQGALAAAREWIDRALQAAPASRALLRQREEILARMHLLTGPHEHLRFVVAQQPQWLEAREQLIRFYLTRCIYPLAAQHLDVALAQHPTRPHLHIDRALVDVESGRRDAAVGGLERALALDPTLAQRVRIAALLIRAGALERALGVAEENHALAPDAPEVRIQNGCFALWQGEVRTAQAWSQGVPDDAPGAARLGAAIAFVDGRAEAALAHADRALAHDANDAEAQALRAAALYRLGRHDEAHRSALTATQRTSEWLPAAQLLMVAAQAAQFPTLHRYEVAELFELLAPLVPDLPADATDAVVHRSVGGASYPQRHVSSRHVLDAIDAALRRLSGNLSAAVTFVPDGGRTWQALAPMPGSRFACVRVANYIQVWPFAEVAARVKDLATRYPRSPYVHTHAAELWLWCGEYGACEAECRQALALTKTEGTRWAWVGLGAALMLQERHAEALEVFAESNRLMEPGGPLLVYRGETLRRRGELDAARADLARSLELSPARVSCWLNLGLIAAARGDAGEVRDIYARLRAHLPELLDDVEGDMAAAPAPGSVDAMGATFAHALAAMRGNRSSGRITYYLADGAARAVAARPLGPA